MKFAWVTIHVNNMKESIVFYRDILHLPVQREMNIPNGGHIVFLGEGETQVELISSGESNNYNEFTESLTIGFIVDSLEKMELTMKNKGYQFHSGPFQPNPHIKFSYVLDPNGVKVQLIEKII